MLRNTKSNKGFTLIELLVVVAIIGILATAGLPQYRRMVAKAKQSEAKVALGAVGTAQAAFFSEYGGYGNNLRAMGVQSDIVDAGNAIVPEMVFAKTYMFGFIAAGATCLPGGGAVVPNGPSAQFNAITANNPGYYVVGAGGYSDTQDAVGAVGAAFGAGAQSISSTVFGRISRNGNCGALPATAVITVPTLVDNFSRFTASAHGVIRSSLPAGGNQDNPLNPLFSDVWVVNERREIANSQHGYD